MASQAYVRARSDLWRAVTDWFVWNSLALADIRSRYRLSTLGTLWITVAMGTQAVAIGLIYGQFFGIDVAGYLPYFLTGFVAWTFIASVIGESASTLVGSGNLIKSSQMPILFYVLRMLQRHVITFLHNLIAVVVLWVFLRWPLAPGALLSIAGVLVCYLFLAGIATIVSVVCVRYRDVPPLIQVVIQFLFLASPVVWRPEQLTHGRFVLEFNPLAYMLTIIRDPLLGRPVDALDWLVAAAFAAGSLLIGAAMYVRFRHRIVYWV